MFRGAGTPCRGYSCFSTRSHSSNLLDFLDRWNDRCDNARGISLPAKQFEWLFSRTSAISPSVGLGEFHGFGQGKVSTVAVHAQGKSVGGQTDAIHGLFGCLTCSLKTLNRADVVQMYKDSM
jgi:hypothetical protein